MQLPEEVPAEIAELCDEILNIPDKGDNILKTAAYIHCKFENIQAFARWKWKSRETHLWLYFEDQ